MFMVKILTDKFNCLVADVISVTQTITLICKELLIKTVLLLATLILRLTNFYTVHDLDKNSAQN